MSSPPEVLNYIAGEWRSSTASGLLDVVNPATTEILDRVPLFPPVEVATAAEAAAKAFPLCRRTAPVERVQRPFKLKGLLIEQWPKEWARKF
jgi:malonate-semialdehyde dehydrogenase (acetylating)/methylmalonate-semialdehyde dehydrogenase